MGGGTAHVQFKGQKFMQIRKQHLNVKHVFCDPLFPPNISSIGNFEEMPEAMEWKRPKDLCESPRLIDGELRPENVVSGLLSSKWFVAACTVLAGISELCHKVIPDYSKQEWNAEKADEYAGIFHFSFWRYGQWVDVVVDDLLPTFENEVLTTRSTNSGEFWVSLIEKAYAKLHGSYEGLKSGHLSDALVDFTGGVSEIIDLKSGYYTENNDEQSMLFSVLDRELTHHCIVCATVHISSPEEEGTRTTVGLSQGETYVVTAIKKVSLGDTGLRKLFKSRIKQCMIRLRDPCGHISSPVHTPVSEGNGDGRSSERGSGSDSGKSSHRSGSGLYSLSKLSRLLSTNPEWAKVKDSDLNKLGLTCEYAGEFWMPFEDFVSHFSQVIVCHLFNTNIFALGKTWKEASFRGTWSTGVKGSKSDRAGGCSTFADTFLRNPQYMFDIKQFEEEIVVQMLQWDTTVTHQVAGDASLLITFHIIRVEENRKYRLHKLWDHTPMVVCFNPVRKREIFYRGSLTRGRYIIIPTAHKPGDIGGFFFRIFSNSNIQLRNIKRDVPSKTCYCCASGYPIWATVVTIKHAENLKRLDTIGSGDPYCVIKCEGKKAKTQIVKNSTHPVWDTSFLFFRKNTDAPVIVQVYYHKTLVPDSFVGQVLLPAPVNQRPTPLTAELMGKGENEANPVQGSLLFEIFTSDNFMEL